MSDVLRIKNALKDEGAWLVGVAPAVKLPEVGAAISRREELGYFAGMGWIEGTSRERIDPALHIEKAISVICTAWPYDTSVSGRHIARFAQQPDYHENITSRLKRAWANSMQDNGRAGFFVDSKPIAEKAYSALAGLGWIGKNTLLINPDIGSFFCIGLIVTDVEFETNKPIEGGCGSCQRCIDACPTGALIEPYLLDCRRCISCLTVEKQEILGRERDMIGSHIYGCDVCQEVCPYNQEAIKEGTIFDKENNLDLLHDLMLLDEAGFKERFGGTGIIRLGRGRFLKNVAIALGNIKDPRSIPVLTKCLQDRDTLIRTDSKWALEQFG